MNRLIRTRTDPAEMRARILEVADEQFRRIGYQKTSVADIASELGMSAANVYRFFSSKGDIVESICGRVVDEVADIAFAIARTSAPASEKLTRLLAAVHHHSKTTLTKEKRVHDMIVAAMRENRAIIKAHIEQMVGIFEAIIREGIEAGEFMVEDSGEAARAVNTAFMPFFHPILLEHCPRHGEGLGAGLREQTRFILKALGKSD
ncbi:TetR/AcrR family transcriptional regulator [Mesorhizobium sp. M00.F.Ca.ET.186.01.1.1]|nr:TetR/AcrR family transcriptional regulator [bacterium M00.F.Ca.ET.205.01.1.1]TGU55480.1 TetR/AcrR family transcriptional regulator [bacterium M00.F.Ca.ET.152.01.1.1]TGV40237.1 TetR/AcrR family transcriptional regulator [Mesorhizobium sp. M00.F.Ca.ET.186.01.1.1]TGZ45576.1 TetR/AcrR family transcriptional regulator [bacterium M00.F.Ca.ET.162.01.1.1]